MKPNRLCNPSPGLCRPKHGDAAWGPVALKRALPSALTAVLLLFLWAAPAAAAPGPCDGQPQCRDLGGFTATVVKVNVTRRDAVTAYQGVRTTLRITNRQATPIVLGYRDRSSQVSDDQGLAYRWSSKAYGIGVVNRGSADTQFELAPGQSREAAFEGVLQYSMRHQVAGRVFSHDLTLVQLVPLAGGQVREQREYALSFSGLTATDGYGAVPATAVGKAPLAGTAAIAGEGGTGTASAAGCTDAPACQATGPIVARVLRVNLTRSGNVTAYQTVRTTVRFTNVSAEPVILGYLRGSGRVSDDVGNNYAWSSKASGIGEVGGGSADPQFQLAPGQSRDAAFESTLQYNVRYVRPGTVFSHDLTIAQLALVGPRQVRTLHEYALSFSGLTAGLAAGGASGGAADLANAASQLVDLFKGNKR